MSPVTCLTRRSTLYCSNSFSEWLRPADIVMILGSDSAVSVYSYSFDLIDAMIKTKTRVKSLDLSLKMAGKSWKTYLQISIHDDYTNAHFITCLLKSANYIVRKPRPKASQGCHGRPHLLFIFSTISKISCKILASPSTRQNVAHEVSAHVCFNSWNLDRKNPLKQPVVLWCLMAVQN